MLIKGSTTGTISDIAGNYRITVPGEDATLVFSFVGYESKEVAVGNRTTIDVSLSPDVSTLDEIVVVGYDSQKRSDLTGSVASVSGKDIEKMPVPTFDLALQGRAPGLQITNTSAEPGGGTSIRIRGSNSVLGNNEPLIVLDGYPLPPGGDAGNAGDTGRGRGQGSNLLSFSNISGATGYRIQDIYSIIFGTSLGVQKSSEKQIDSLISIANDLIYEDSVEQAALLLGNDLLQFTYFFYNCRFQK